MLDNTQYIAIIAIGVIITFASYYMESNNDNESTDINYTKYLTIFIVTCSIAIGGIYTYNNPEVVGPNLLDESINSEIRRATSSGFQDPSVIASLPDF
jgi:hypothetical protein